MRRLLTLLLVFCLLCFSIPGSVWAAQGDAGESTGDTSTDAPTDIAACRIYTRPKDEAAFHSPSALIMVYDGDKLLRNRQYEMHFSQMTTFGDHLYRREEQVAEIIMENSRTGVRKTIVDDHGIIMGFPGLAHPELIELYCNEYVGKRIRFRSDISKLGDQYALIWQIQPDGRYWEDEDGFGCTPDDEINLYARLDDEGKFIEPFYLYSIGSNTYYGTEQERNAALALSSKKDPLTSLLEHVPELLCAMREKVMVPESGRAIYNIPGTVYQARLTLKTELEK